MEVQGKPRQLFTKGRIYKVVTNSHDSFEKRDYIGRLLAVTFGMLVESVTQKQLSNTGTRREKQDGTGESHSFNPAQLARLIHVRFRQSRR